MRLVRGRDATFFGKVHGMSTSVPKKANKFPLFVHKGRGYWCKTVLGKHHYFGKVSDDPQGKHALKLWLYERDWLMAGLEPPAYDPDGEATISVKYVCNEFIASKEAKLKAGNLSQRTFDELKDTCKLTMSCIPPALESKLLVPAHFAKLMAKINSRYQSPNSRGKFVGQVKAIFRHAYSEGFIDRPVNFGASFCKPPASAYQELENSKGDQSFTPEEIHALLKHANIQARAMILLSLQSGFSNTELCDLKRTAIKGDWIECARAKTKVNRRVPLWPETKAALQAAIDAGKPDGEYVFYRLRARFESRRVGYLFQTVAEKAGVTGHTFYDLRRSFQTVAENATMLDLPAIQSIMGHKPHNTDMSARYRQNISDERLKSVVAGVRKWLGKLPKGGAK
jgi:integrase